MTKVAFNTGDQILKESEIEDQQLVIEVEYDVFFQINHCVQFIQSNHYQNIALQFPDELMTFSKYVAQKIQGMLAVKCFILADTSYGSCCVDEVAASHYKADALIHFGHTCLSKTQKLPVFYVFGKALIDMENLVLNMKDVFSDSNEKILMFYSVEFYYTLYESLSKILSLFPNLVFSDISHINLNKENFNDTKFTLGRAYKLNSELERYKILFIGNECVTLKNLMFTLNKNQFYLYSPSSKKLRRETLNINKTLMRRYYLIEKAKDSQIIGIVMGTLGVKRYKEIVDRLKRVLKDAGKKFYTFVVGKVNVPKMANFMEIDMFVLVSCPENSLIDSKEYYKPIITPYEIEVACLHSREWTGDYITDFQQLLPGSVSYVEIPDSKEERREPEFSLVTGLLRSNFRTSDDDGPDSLCAVQIRNNETQIVSKQPTSALEYLSMRSWKGLEVNSGKTEVKKVEIGREGIAMSYTHEPLKEV